jgi:hypothetical protein
LLIAINTGEIYILDCLKMNLVPNESASEQQYIQGKIPEFASMDMKSDLLACVGETGLGKLMTLRN